MGTALSPSEAEELAELPEDWLDLFPFLCVGLLTSTHLRWTPHRMYRGRRVYREPVDRVLSEGAPPPKHGIYGMFDTPLLGPRAVRVEHIKRVSLDNFSPVEAAFVNIHLTDSFEMEGPSGWPEYELSAHWEHTLGAMKLYRENPETRYLQFCG